MHILLFLSFHYYIFSAFIVYITSYGAYGVNKVSSTLWMQDVHDASVLDRVMTPHVLYCTEITVAQ